MALPREYGVNYIPSEEDLIIPTNLEELFEAMSFVEVLTKLLDKFEPDSNHPGFFIRHQQKRLIDDFMKKNGEYKNGTFIKNIFYLTKQHNIGIGDLEKILGISAGYISRTTNENSNKKMSIDVMWKIARLFNIDIVTLIEHDLEKAKTRNYETLVSFLRKLNAETEANTIEWINRGGKTKEIDYLLQCFSALQRRSQKTVFLKSRQGEVDVYDLASDVFGCRNLSNAKELIFVVYEDQKTEERNYDLYFMDDPNSPDDMCCIYSIFTTQNPETEHLKPICNHILDNIQIQETYKGLTPEIMDIITRFIN